jgi:hypothetical protein
MTVLPAHARLEPTITPEMDPSLGLGVLVFIGGAIMVIRGRRKT